MPAQITLNARVQLLKFSKRHLYPTRNWIENASTVTIGDEKEYNHITNGKVACIEVFTEKGVMYMLKSDLENVDIP